MKKLLLLLVALITVFTLSACGGLEEKYPAEGEDTFTFEEVQALIDETIEEYYQDEIRYNVEYNYQLSRDNYSEIGFNIAKINAMMEEMDDMDWYMEDNYDLILENQLIMEIMFEYILVLNDEARIMDAMYHEDEELQNQYDELSLMYQDYLIENFPDYFTEEDFDFPQEYYKATQEGFSVTIEYTQYNYVIIVDRVEVCGEVCEDVTFNQTDFVLTIEEVQEVVDLMLIDLLELMEEFN